MWPSYNGIRAQSTQRSSCRRELAVERALYTRYSGSNQHALLQAMLVLKLGRHHSNNQRSQEGPV